MDTQKHEFPKLFTSQEVADILKMNAQVIARKLQAGEIEGYKIGKDWRVSEAQLMSFLEKHSNQRAKAAPEEKIVRGFLTADGRLKTIPAARAKREEVLRYLVRRLEPNRVYEEKEINEFIARFHEDVCTIRREFIISKLMVRQAGKYKVSSWNRGRA